MDDEQNITEQHRTLGALLRLPYQKLQEQTYSELAASGFSDIRPAHSNVFRHILPGGSRVTEMAERAQLTKQSMAYLVNYLHERDYVNLMNDPNDGRAKIVTLTAKGVAVQEAALQLSKQAEDRLAARMGAPKMAQLRALLEKMADNVESLDLGRREG